MKTMFSSEACTRGIRVRVQSRFLPEHSRPDRQQWIFGYTVEITNESDTPVQLISRHWIITDGNDVEQEVQGEGVVGEQPVIKPGESYQYSSFCPLGTAFGTMHGTYQMRPTNGKTYNAEIARFALCQPQAVH